MTGRVFLRAAILFPFPHALRRAAFVSAARVRQRAVSRRVNQRCSLVFPTPAPPRSIPVERAGNRDENFTGKLRVIREIAVMVLISFLPPPVSGVSDVRQGCGDHILSKSCANIAGWGSGRVKIVESCEPEASLYLIFIFASAIPFNSRVNNWIFPLFSFKSHRACPNRSCSAYFYSISALEFRYRGATKVER